MKQGMQKNLQLSNGRSIGVYSLESLALKTGKSLKRLPYSIRILVENLLRNVDGKKVKEEDVLHALNWQPQASQRSEVPYMPARVVMQDFTGVPAVVDLAAMRDAVQKQGGDAQKINPLVETVLVVDHSVQVDFSGNSEAMEKNIDLEFQRNQERYQLLKWAQEAFQDFKVVPPGMGIIHQVNLEYLSPLVLEKKGFAYPDTLVGTDSHTTMINGLGVMGWGVGGIEAEAVMLGQPYYMELPDVVGVRLVGGLPLGVTGTDLVLVLTQMLRKQGVVGKFVEFFGEGLKTLSLPDRATVANMAPEYGATMGFFPVDEVTLDFMKQSNRGHFVDLIETVLKHQFLFREDMNEEPEYSVVLTLDLSVVDSSLAGPKRPQDRVPLKDLQSNFQSSLTTPVDQRGFGLSAEHALRRVKIDGMDSDLAHGAVTIAAITSCTNTSNPFVMIGAGLLARNAVQKGLQVKPYVKTSLAPGSQVVTAYLEKAGLMPYLNQLHFNVVGYGCTTCIGNSGSLAEPVIAAIQSGDLVAAAVLSGNRNFEGRINPYVKANYLASPIHVVAFALAGSVNFNVDQDALGLDTAGQAVYLRDIWPSHTEIQSIIKSLLTPEMFAEKYAAVFEGPEIWKQLCVPKGQLYAWDTDSTYIQCPPFFDQLDLSDHPASIMNARALLVLGDSVTTDHISPAGSIPAVYPAGQYLQAHGVAVKDFNSYGSRRGNHEVMMRGTFANVRLHNALAHGKEGSFTEYFPTGEAMYIYDAAMRYQDQKIPLYILAGKEYGTGSSRDWAAKGTYLLGVKFVIAETYERIHRGNLVGMGVLPLQFLVGESASSLGLTGYEALSIFNLDSIHPRQEVIIHVKKQDGREAQFKALLRLDNEVEVDYFRNGGILQTVLKEIQTS